MEAIRRTTGINVQRAHSARSLKSWPLSRATKADGTDEISGPGILGLVCHNQAGQGRRIGAGSFKVINGASHHLRVSEMELFRLRSPEQGGI